MGNHASSQQGQMLPVLIPQLPSAMGSLDRAALGPSEAACKGLYFPARESRFHTINANGETEAQVLYSAFAQEEPYLVHFFALFFSFFPPFSPILCRKRACRGFAGMLLPSVR